MSEKLLFPAQTQILIGNPARQLAASFPLRVFFFLALHLPLGQLLALSGWLGTLHALLVLVYGLRAALQRRTDRVLYALAYVTGAEILWRMTRANLFWESGKYAVALLVVAALLAEFRNRQRDSSQARTLLPFLFLLLLLPAAVPTFLQLDFSDARQQVSFNLSGPLSLALLVYFLSSYRASHTVLVRTLLAALAPILPIAFRASLFTLTRNVTYTLDSLHATSGGFGPNQVSNLLGFGAFLALLLFLILRPHRRLAFILLLAGFWLLVQAILTFSRGGVFSLALAAAVFALHILRAPGLGKRTIFAFAFLALLGYFVLVPELETLTAGAFSQRFSSLNTTNRAEFIQVEWRAFLENPLVGAGVGLMKDYRYQVAGSTAAAHTEYSRLLAEHGLFGLAALLILGFLLWRRYWQAAPGLRRALAAAFSVWAASVMAQSAMRFVAISFALGLCFVTWEMSRELFGEPADG